MTTNEQLTAIVGEIASALSGRLGGEITVGAAAAGTDVLAATAGEGFAIASLPYAGANGGIAVVALSNELAAQLTTQETSLDALTLELAAPMLASLGAQAESVVPIDNAVLLERANAARLVMSVGLEQGGNVIGSVSLVSESEEESDAESAEFESFDQTNNVTPIGSRSMELLNDVEMGVAVELGRTRMSVRDILGLTPGSVVELDRAAGSAVDMLVNGTLVARGEVVVIDEEFGIRITEIIGHENKQVG
jgi:flagellar motor switch protein FliN/FliY